MTKKYHPHEQMTTILEYECAFNDKTKEYLTVNEVIQLLNSQDEKIQNLNKENQILKEKIHSMKEMAKEVEKYLYDIKLFYDY